MRGSGDGDDADWNAARGFFDFGRGRIEIGGQKVGGAMDSPSENTLRIHARGPPGPMQVHYNGERATGQTWPLADGHVTVIEIDE